MTQIEKPEWLEGWQPAPPKAKPEPKPRTGSPTWVKGMPSPNKAGRPKGIVDKRAKIAQRMLADAESIVSALIEKAQDGDTGAASLILSRVLPSIRGQAEKVCFDFDATASAARQVEQVLDACASGLVAPDVARMIIDSIKALTDVRAFEDLDQRLTLLEARQI